MAAEKREAKKEEPLQEIKVILVEDERKEEAGRGEEKRVEEQVEERRIRSEPVGNYILDSQYGIMVNSSGVVVSDYLIDESKDWRQYNGEMKGSKRAYSIDPSYHYDAGASLGKFTGRMKKRAIRASSIDRNITSSRVNKDNYKEVTTRSLLRDLMSILQVNNDRELEYIVYYIVGAYHEEKRKNKESMSNLEVKVLAPVALEEASLLTARPIPTNKIYEVFYNITGLGEEHRNQVETLAWKIKRKIAEYDIKRRIMLYRRMSRQSMLLSKVYGHIEHIVSVLKMNNKIIYYPEKVRSFARLIVEYNVTEMRKSLSGKRSEAIAAAAVYIAARLFNNEVTQTDVARVVKLKDSNIRKAFKFLLSGVQILGVLEPVSRVEEK
ncbi:MAG: hypothetical protein LRS48_05815 [Desulfurococcales archaeon]|nr:hypothetical protein [Desulfurococcales archaeon]